MFDTPAAFFSPRREEEREAIEFHISEREVIQRARQEARLIAENQHRQPELYASSGLSSSTHETIARRL
jgi:hypothetical protein